ncbi:MAG TPA: DUF2103 domain-containing protein [Patescibacteria group bacterium]|nr:DUF2103 domain-containing protein [Patescibacteria group bacterium]
MGNKGHRAGGKFGGTHTTFIPLAEIFADIAAEEQHVTNIIAGFIKGGLPSANGQRKIKIIDRQGGILLSIRDNTSHQKVMVYTSNTHKTKLVLSRAIRNRNIHLCFGEQADE